MELELINADDVIMGKALYRNLIVEFLVDFPYIHCLDALRTDAFSKQDVYEVLETPDLYEQLLNAYVDLKEFSKVLYATLVSRHYIPRSEVISDKFCKITTPNLVYNEIMSYIYKKLRGELYAI